jgi:hypothetical protein
MNFKQSKYILNKALSRVEENAMPTEQSDTYCTQVDEMDSPRLKFKDSEKKATKGDPTPKIKPSLDERLCKSPLE